MPIDNQWPLVYRVIGSTWVPGGDWEGRGYLFSHRKVSTMPRGKAHSEQTKAAVMAALLAGQGVEEVAKQYDLPTRTVFQWAAKDGEFAQVRTQKRESIDDLLTGYLQETLLTLQVQQRFFRDEEWLKKQPANELAVLHGVSTDKAIRLLEAAERANQQPPPPDEDAV